MVECSGLESHCRKPQETAENAQFCGSGGTQEAMFAEGSAPSVGAEVGTPLRRSWRLLRFFAAKRYNRFDTIVMASGMVIWAKLGFLSALACFFVGSLVSIWMEMRLNSLPNAGK